MNTYFTKKNRPWHSEEILVILNEKFDKALSNLPSSQGYPGVEHKIATQIERKFTGKEVRYYFFDRDDKLIDRTVVASTDKKACKKAKQQGIKFFTYCEESEYLDILQDQMEQAERAAGWDPTP
jgi:hypothetical protein